MRKAKKRTSTTIGIMLIFTIIVLLIYYYASNLTEPLIEDSVENLTEVEKILNQDYVNYYPETPRELVKEFARIMRALYSNPKDEEINPLALKIRELYDIEFIENNPEDTYLINLKTDISNWNDKNRKITNFLLLNEELDEQKLIDNVKYSVNYVQYTIQESGKFTETWKILLRQDSNKRWRILGWEFVPITDSE